MKKSNCIVDYDSLDGKSYLFNTWNGSVVSVGIEKKRHLQNILKRPNEYSGIKGYQTLCDYGFIIPDKTNECQIIYGQKILRHYCKSNYLELIIMPTEQCNFRCVYCYENFIKPSMNVDTQDAIIRFVKRELINRKGLAVSWFGG